jgi:hypothetical protein
MYNLTNSSPTLTNCTFSGNEADVDQLHVQRQ